MSVEGEGVGVGVLLPSQDVEVELSFPGHPVAHIITIPASIATTYLATPAAMHVMDERQLPPRDVSKQIASYGDQVKEMKGRINWLKESLRRSGPCAAEEHAQDLGKFFAVQSIKVEELRQQIDVFSEELRQWKDVDTAADNRFSALARAVIQGDLLGSGKPVENVRVQLSDLVDFVAEEEEEEEEEQRPCLTISRSELEMKRKAMGARMKYAKHEAKRRKVQEVKVPFKVGIPTSTRRVAEKWDGRKSQGGVRTVQLRKSNNSSSNNTKGKCGGTNSTMSCINSLQREVLRLKEILEERELQLSSEQRKRYDMENRHAVEARAFLKEAEERTRQLKLEETMRVQAEEKVVVLQAALHEAQERGKRLPKEHDVVEPAQEQQSPVYVDDGVQVSNDEDQEERPPTLNRLYERELAINATHLRQALKLKSIAEAKVENLKKQVIALKRLTGELQYEKQQQHGRFRKEAGNVGEVERLQTQILQLKKQVVDKTRELESEHVKKVDDDEQVSSTVLQLQNEVVSYKKLALDRAAELRVERKHRCKVENQVKELRCQLDDLGAQAKCPGQYRAESYGYDAISHKQNRRLQLSLKKSRQNYEQLHEFWRKEQECRLSSDTQCRKLQSICSSHAERLEELGSSLEDLLADIEDQQSDNKRQKKDVRVDTSSPGDSKLETSEKLLLLLDKLAKGLDGEQEVCLDGSGGRKPEALVAEMRKQVSEMARSLRQEVQVQPEPRSGKEVFPDPKSVQQLPNSLTAEQQVVYLGRLCTLQSKKLRAAEGRVATLKKHVSRLRDVTERPDSEREQERAWRGDSAPKNSGSEVAALKQQLQRLKAASRLQDSDSIARLKLLEIQVLEYKRQAEEKAKDLKHERSLRFDLESKSAAEVQRLRHELQIARPQQQDVCVQAEESNEMGVHALELQVFVLELVVGEKTEALLHEKKERGDAEGRMHELATLLSYAQVEIANANERAEELSQLCACQGHKVTELTGLLELFVKKLDEYERCQVEMEGKLCVEHDQRSRLSAELQLEHADKLRLETELEALDGMIWNSGGSDEFVRLTSMEDEDKGNSVVAKHASVRLKSCEDFIGNLKKHVRDLELSGEVLRYRDKVWRRGLLAIDQVLLLCFGALFAFNRMTVLLREIVPT